VANSYKNHPTKNKQNTPHIKKNKLVVSAKLDRVDGMTRGLLHGQKHGLKLRNDVVWRRIGRDLQGKYVSAERGNHKQLLHKRVDVARCALVLEPRIATNSKTIVVVLVHKPTERFGHGANPLPQLIDHIMESLGSVRA
jgi:hypothetical protein